MLTKRSVTDLGIRLGLDLEEWRRGKDLRLACQLLRSELFKMLYVTVSLSKCTIPLIFSFLI